VDAAPRQAAPRPADRAPAPRGQSELGSGLIAGIDFDQALRDLSRYLARIESGKPFALRDAIQLERAARTATKETLGRLSEAYLADPDALREQAPTAYALIDAVVNASSDLEVGKILSGARPVVPRSTRRRAGDVEPSLMRTGTPDPKATSDRVKGAVKQAVTVAADVRDAAFRHGAMRLLEHSSHQITDTVYRRVGAKVKATK
jgi:hypothetical protein